ncbi:hypothetical protein [Streptacidiphilus sp. EB129]|uniref:hypothetical protein n=1 Tax=Streptacidiphilus sp. EB129 TaxID=3156262 RepID=UPI0035182057
MTYRNSFSELSPVELLHFAKCQAGAALGADGNAWIRLVDIAAAGMRRSVALEDRDAFAEAAMVALDEMRSGGFVPERRWAIMALKVHVDRVLICDPLDSQKRVGASIAYQIFFGQLAGLPRVLPGLPEKRLGADLDRSDLQYAKRLAHQICRIASYLSVDQSALIEELLSVDSD